MKLAKSGVWTISLDKAKHRFVLLRPGEDVLPEESILTLSEDQMREGFEKVCTSDCKDPSLDQIYCYGCDDFGHGICPQHPLVFVQNLPIKGDAANTLPNFLQLKHSSIPDAGFGIFTQILIPAGSAFGPYEGVLLDWDDAKADSDYSWELIARTGEEHLTVDASDKTHSNFLRWINCARYKEEQNMVCFQFEQCLFYVVVRPVHPGEELLIWYGASYARRLGIVNLKRATSTYAPPKFKKVDTRISVRA